MSPHTKNLLFYSALSLVVAWMLHSAIVKGEIDGQSGYRTYAIGKNPIRFLLSFLVLGLGLVFCAAEVLYGFGLIRDPAPFVNSLPSLLSDL